MDVMVAGSCMMDLISYAHRQAYYGETVQGFLFETGFGGRGANQCCQAAKLGAKTGIVSVLGNDIYADPILENLKKFNINTETIRKIERWASGTYTMTISDDGKRSTAITPSANFCMFEEDVIRARDLIMGAKVVLCQMEVHPHISFVTLRMARNSGVCTILNCAPVWRDMNPELFSNCDIVVVNEYQAWQVADMEVKDVETARTAGKLILARGCKSVIITLGEEGSVLTSDEYDGIHTPAAPAKVVDTRGAGNSFIGAVAYFKALLPSLSLLEIVRRAHYIAARCVEKRGSQDSFPWASELPAEIMTIQEEPEQEP